MFPLHRLRQELVEACEAQQNTTKAKPARLLSLDTFRGYVRHQQPSCLSVYHHMWLVHMLILFRSVWGMMKIYRPNVMNNYRGHSLATGSPRLCYRAVQLRAWFGMWARLGFGTVCFCWTGVMHVIESGLPASLNCGLGVDTKHASLETGCWCGFDLPLAK